jgi:hypothetical protein
MLFNLFDLESNNGLEVDEFIIMFIAVFEGWFRFT